MRGFHTNVGELTHRFVNVMKADIVFVSETFLDASIPPNYARIRGYSTWMRKDRTTQGGGVAFCYKASLNVIMLDISTPYELEVMFLKLVGDRGRGTLCVGCYRPPSQGTTLIDFLMDNLDRLMTEHQCDNVIIIGDLNPPGIRRAFNSLLTVFNLQNHVTFPTHCSGSSLDPVISDFPSHHVKCSSLGPVGSSDHVAVYSCIKLNRSREESVTRTLWRWEKANWRCLRSSLAEVNWKELLKGDVDLQVERFTETLLRAQDRWVPHSEYRSKPSDQPWFGPECRAAADRKYRAWRSYKRHPTRYNKDRHKEAVTHMAATQEWAWNQWIEDKRRKLRGGNAGSKIWWGIVQDFQGESKDSTIPPLRREDGSVAASTKDKVDLLAGYFSSKMTVPDPTRPPPSLPIVAGKKLISLTTTEVEVRAALSTLEESKAVGPDGVSPRVLRRCCAELAQPLTWIFKAILQHNKWPRMWKDSQIVPVHKKGSRSEAKNYRPISLLSVVGKVLEAIIAERLTNHLESQHLLNLRQFGFRKGRSAADLNLLLVEEWSNALDQGRPTAVLALDIASAFDRVWHPALVERLRAAGVSGPLLELMRDYLRERHMRVVHNGQQSSQQTISAGVPQGSVLGPLLWNIYINDVLNLVPGAKAYADDITLSLSFTPGEEKVVSSRLSSILHRLVRWGERWQVTFAPHKTQLLVVSRTAREVCLNFNGTTVTPQKELKILGVTYDSKLSFQAHITQLTRQAAGKLASLRRISWLLDSRGREILYKAQIRSLLEYSCLAWGGAARTHLAMLDRIQRRAERIIVDNQPESRTSLHSLQHRRDVAGLTTLFKVQVQRDAHLQPLHQPARQTTACVRAAVAAPSALLVTRSNTSHHQRQFTQRYVRLWNIFLASGMGRDDLSVTMSGAQQFKVNVNKWLSEVRISDSDTFV